MPRPLVVTGHNPRPVSEAFEDEQDLNIKTHRLIEWLQEFRTKDIDSMDLPDIIESVWIDLFERGFIEMEDVFLVQLWIQALIDIGYR